MHFNVKKLIFSQLPNLQKMFQGIFIMTETYSKNTAKFFDPICFPLGCGIYFLILGIFGVIEITFRANEWYAGYGLP